MKACKFVLFCFVISTTHAATNYVSLSGSHTSPYTSWATAATNIQDAVDAAVTLGDTVLVTNGTYYLTATIVVTNGATVESVNGAGNTIIDGQSAVRGLSLDGSATVDGFTITHCDATTGAGVYLDGGGTVQNCMIASNGVGVNGQGAGAYLHQGGLVTNCTLTGNYAGQAGASGSGIYLYQGGEVQNSTIRNGTGTAVILSGGGLLKRCNILNNSTSGTMGGVQCSGGGTLRNCLIAGNRAVYHYAGIRADSAALIENCTITGNVATNRLDSFCGGLRADGTTVRNTIIYGNIASVGSDLSGDSSAIEYSCSPGLTTGTGNITNNPQFVDTATGNYRLLQASSCRDTGMNLAWSAAATDLDGNTRKMNGTVDMGAYEFLAGEHSGASLTHYVSLNSPTPSWPYTSWKTASGSIQEAINTAQAGDTVFVTNGTYTSALEITISKAVTVKSVNGRDVTIIDGQNAHRCFNLGNSACTLSGFTITHGYVSEADGGGVYCTGTSPTITNCTLTGNSVAGYGSGGGINHGTLIDCTLSNNSAKFGGGSGYGILNHCMLSSNSASSFGGGSYDCTLNNCTLSSNARGGSWGGTLNNCTITNNTNSFGGGSSSGTLNNCTISGNSASVGGGGSYQSTLNNCTITDNSSDNFAGGSGHGILNNCTITGNSSRHDGGGTFGGTLKNCIIWNNTATYSDSNNWHESVEMTWSCTEPLHVGTGNITRTPLFLSSSDFHLQSNSPCIDAGTAIAGITDDLDGTPRPLDGDANGSAFPDIGAYEYINEAGDTDGDGILDGVELSVGLTSPVYDDSAGIAYGRQDVTGNPDVHGLYTADSISDLDMGYMMLQTSNGWMRMNLQLEQCTNVTENVWTNAGEAVLWEIEAAEGKAFFRVRAKE